MNPMNQGAKGKNGVCHLISLGKAPHQKPYRRATRTNDPQEQLFEGEMRPEKEASMHLCRKQHIFTKIEDPRESQFTYCKIILVEKNILLVSLLELFLGMLRVQASSTASWSGDALAMLLAMDVTSTMLVLLVMVRALLLLRLEVDQKRVYLPSGWRKGEWNIIRLAWFHHQSLLQLGAQLLLVAIHPSALFHEATYSIYSEHYLVDVTYSLNDLLSVIMLAKVYLIIRAAVAITPFATPRASRVCRQSGLQHNFFFTIKCLQKEYPLWSTSAFFALTTLLFSFGMRASEGRVSSLNAIDSNGFQNYQNCYWFVFITMFSIGYGEYYPVTFLGRALAVLLSVIGVVLNSLLVVALTEDLKMKDSQGRSLTTLQRLQEDKVLQGESAQALVETMKVARLLSAEQLDPLVLQPHFNCLKKKVDRAKTRIKHVKSIIPTQNYSQEMLKSFEVIKDNFRDIEKNQRRMKNKIERIREQDKTVQEEQYIRRSFIQHLSQLPSELEGRRELGITRSRFNYAQSHK